MKRSSPLLRRFSSTLSLHTGVWELDWLDRLEMPVVRAQVVQMRRPALRAIALVLGHLANGWLYVLIGAVLLLEARPDAWRIIGAAAVAIALAHGIYPLIKSRMARPRPIDRDATLATLLAPLDAHSFPSGHCMTAAAALWPLGYRSALAPALVLLFVAIGWARLAAGHHYPSDLAAGALLGLSIAIPVTWTIMG